MCNPRRVKVTATREVQESWQRVVERQVELSEEVAGEARVSQNLGGTLGDSVLIALRRALTRGAEGWEPVDGGYCHEVEGGYVVYRPETQNLEIVAVDQTTVQADVTSRRVVEGETRAVHSTEAESTWYDDHWGGRTEEVAQNEADALAQRRLDNKVRQSVEADQAAAEREVEDEARITAQEQLTQSAEAERARLAQQARDNLENVGVRCNLAFNRLLANAMRDALAAYARLHGGTVVRCSDEQQGELVMDIELQV